ncbi:glutathione peroxidase [Solirubrobacter phytolaccae]|uniref:Glutathione peroxidase n=1 Tax=Solirubrobacter phytolaccae TaxID=1404360 RepID=A0A9X3SE43_9ACTN|nr:glutathione peroxidase [Solirubrobacter phytolaccae]MDA0184505.1 glutathione peroxidase [Solirubrobacter phytolaccae]
MGLLSTAKLYLRRTSALEEPTDLYEHEIGLLEGGTLDLRELRGRPTLFVNTASKCGLTPQFAGLQDLYDTYGSRGLQIVGTPSGDFAGQELDDDAEIAAFCQRNYGVSFTITEKVSVRADPHPLWDDLARQPGSAPPTWNFSKYLVGGDGKLIARFSSRVAPDATQVTEAIEAALKPKGRFST